GCSSCQTTNGLGCWRTSPPRISTVIQPSYEVGVRAAELLLKRIENPKRAFKTILLAPQLRIRE
ncbi:MAG: substrate-binding domain-containing protein, partial [Acidobacteriota bacterium]